MHYNTLAMLSSAVLWPETWDFHPFSLSGAAWFLEKHLEECTQGNKLLLKAQTDASPKLFVRQHHSSSQQSPNHLFVTFTPQIICLQPLLCGRQPCKICFQVLSGIPVALGCCVWVFCTSCCFKVPRWHYSGSQQSWLHVATNLVWCS